MSGNDHTFRHRTAGVLGLAVAGILLSACSGGSDGATTPSAAAASTGTATSSAVAASGSAATGSATTSGSTGATGGATTCAEDQLKATIDADPPIGSANSGVEAVIVYFQNTSSTTCTISGYPGAALVDDSGKQAQQAERTLRGQTLGLPTGEDSPPVVTLQPGAYASAGLEGTSTKETGAAQAGCDGGGYPQILVTPPNTEVPVPFTTTWPACFRFTVHPVNIENNPPS